MSVVRRQASESVVKSDGDGPPNCIGCDEPQVEPEQPHGQHPHVPEWQSYSSVFTNAKAGMGGVDQQKVKQVIYEMSKVR